MPQRAHDEAECGSAFTFSGSGIDDEQAFLRDVFGCDLRILHRLSLTHLLLVTLLITHAWVAFICLIRVADVALEQLTCSGQRHNSWVLWFLGRGRKRECGLCHSCPRNCKWEIFRQWPLDASSGRRLKVMIREPGDLP